MTNAKFYRNLVCAGLGALAISHVSLSHAYYAQAGAPTGFLSGAINTFNGAKAGATASLQLGRIAANASLNVGGKAVSIATKIPYGAGAARVAAGLIYLHPAVRTGLAIAGILSLAGLSFDLDTGTWVKANPSAVASDGFSYFVESGAVANQFLTGSSPSDVCGKYIAELKAASSSFNGYVYVPQAKPDDFGGCSFEKKSASPLFARGYRSASSCPLGWYVTPAGCVQKVPGVAVPQEKFVDDLTKQPKFPNILPELPFDLPVEVPYIEPIFIPTGNPVPNPNYDPTKPQTGDNQPYVQPGVKVDPANDAKSPFQVNVQPTNRPSSSPTGSTESRPITTGTGTETDGKSDRPKGDEDTRDLCEKNPEILACQKVDTDVEDKEIPKAEKSVSYQAENVFGFGACPTDKYTRVGGQQIMVQNWQRDCQMITDYVRPVTLVIASLIVAGILAGALKS